MNKLAISGGILLLLLSSVAAAWLGLTMGVWQAVVGVVLALVGAWSLYAAIENDVSELGMLGAMVLMGLIAVLGLPGLGIFIVAAGGGFLLTAVRATD
jgi:hypothetical protein